MGYIFLKYHLDRSTDALETKPWPFTNCHPFGWWLVISVSIWRSKVAPWIEDISLISPLGITASKTASWNKTNKIGVGAGPPILPQDTQGTKTLRPRHPTTHAWLTSHQLRERHRPRRNLNLHNLKGKGDYQIESGGTGFSALLKSIFRIMCFNQTFKRYRRKNGSSNSSTLINMCQGLNSLYWV